MGPKLSNLFGRARSLLPLKAQLLPQRGNGDAQLPALFIVEPCHALDLCSAHGRGISAFADMHHARMSIFGNLGPGVSPGL